MILQTNERLRIAVIGGSVAKGGGASQVALDLVAVLGRAGHSAIHLVAEDAAPPRSIYPGPRLASLACRAEQKLRRYGLPHALPLDLPFLLAANLPRHFDILHFHDLGPGMSPLTIGTLSRLMPTAWTFHDCAPFTGGCTYPMTCRKYLTRCGTDGGCPQIGAWPMGELYDVTGGLQAMRTRVQRLGRIRSIAPSDWLADLAFASGTLQNRPKVISNGADLSVFRPAPDRAALRRSLGLPTDRPIVLLSAAIIADRRKGISDALQALAAISDLRPLALIVGKSDPSLDAALAGQPAHITGHIADRSILARWYNAADLFLNCTWADNQPLIVLETMGCGIPTVGFASGGVPAMITQNQSGLLVEPGDIPALIAALRHALEPGIAAAWGAAARQRVESLFSLDRFGQEHLSLYTEMLTRRPGGAARKQESSAFL